MVICRELFDITYVSFECYKILCVLMQTRERGATTILGVCCEFCFMLPRCYNVKKKCYAVRVHCLREAFADSWEEIERAVIPQFLRQTKKGFSSVDQM
jgi:hypothetical protein